MQGITDLPGGGFRLEPKPRVVRMFKVIAIASGALSVAIFLAFVVFAVVMSQPLWLLGSVLFAVMSGGAEWVLWRAVRPPVLKADAETVTYRAGFRTESAPRAELTMIFKGQVVQRARYTAWVQSYVFAIGAGKVMFAVPALWFQSEDIDAFAERLRLPVRGDFTQRVQDVINRSAGKSTRY